MISMRVNPACFFMDFPIRLFREQGRQCIALVTDLDLQNIPVRIRCFSGRTPGREGDGVVRDNVVRTVRIAHVGSFSAHIVEQGHQAEWSSVCGKAS